MKIQYLERELDVANAKIENLKKSNFDSAPQPIAAPFTAPSKGRDAAPR